MGKKPPSLEEISKEINKYFSNNPSNFGFSTEKKEKQLFSSDFLKKLEKFDKISSDLEGVSVTNTPEIYVGSKKIEFSDEISQKYEKPTHFAVNFYFIIIFQKSYY